jgi:hypothetical protein
MASRRALNSLPSRQLGYSGSLGHVVPYQEEELDVFHHAGQIPVRLDVVRRLVVVLPVELLPLRIAPTLGPVPETGAGVDVEGGHTLLGELEVVGPVEEPLLGLSVRLHHASLSGGVPFQDVLERRAAPPDDDHVLGPAPGKEGVHIDDRQRPLQRVEGVLRVVSRPEQPLLFGRHCQEQDRPIGCRLQHRVGPSHLDERRRAGGVVHGPL